MLTYVMVLVSFTLGFMFSAVLGRNKACAVCENQEGAIALEKNTVPED